MAGRAITPPLRLGEQLRTRNVLLLPSDGNEAPASPGGPDEPASP
jgi:hypothetical protein